MILVNRLNISHIWTQIIYMVGLMSKPLPISNFKWMKNLHNWRNPSMYTGGRFGISRAVTPFTQ